MGFKTVSIHFGMLDSSFRKYYSCISNDDFICNFTKLSVVSKLRSLPTNADGSISDEQKDVIISYLAPSYFTVDAMLLAVDAAEVAYWASVAAGAMTGGASTVAAQLAKQVLINELISLGIGNLKDEIIESIIRLIADEDIAAYFANNSQEFYDLWKMNREVGKVMESLLPNTDEPQTNLDFDKFSKGFDAMRTLVITSHQVGIYLDFIEISLYTGIDYVDLFMINVEMNNNFNNGFADHLIANAII